MPHFVSVENGEGLSLPHRFTRPTIGVHHSCQDRWDQRNSSVHFEAISGNLDDRALIGLFLHFTSSDGSSGCESELFSSSGG